MKGIYLVVILYVATLNVALNVSPVTGFLTECPTNVKPRNKTIYIPHESDCTKFYNCYMGKKGIPQDCPFMDNDGNRLHFNPKLQVCDWPWNAECQLSSIGPTSTPKLTNPTTPPISPSSLSTILPSSSLTSLSNLPPSTTLPPSSSTPLTSPPSESSTTISSSSSPTSTTTSLNPPTTTTLSPSSSTSPTLSSSDSSTISPSSSISPTSSFNPPSPTTTSANSWTPTPTNSLTPSITTQNTVTSPSYTCEFDNKSHMIPHKTMCDHYYTCFNGKINPKPKKCDRNLLFNPVLRVCDYPENVNCNHTSNIVRSTTITIPAISSSIKVITTTPSISPLPSPSIRTTTTSALTTITTAIPATTHAFEKPRQKCPPKESTEIARIADSCLCNIYYECVNGIKMQQTCPTGMHFDYVREICDWAETVNCVRPISIVDVLIGSCQSNKCYPEGRAFQHETDCSSYYLCSEGKKILKHCTAGLHFNVTLQICDYPTKIGCNLTPKFLSMITQSGCPSSGSSKEVLLPHECSCKQYYECVNGKQRLRKCPNGLHFDHIRKKCNQPNKANCPYICPCPYETEKILLPHECKCEQYYECVRGKQRQRFCPKGLHFDSIQKTCGHPDDANCATSTTTTTTTTTPTDPTKTSTTTDTTTTSTITTTTDPTDKPRKNCPPKGSTEKARIAHPFVCNRYYECVNGEKILKICPIGKHFDYVREVCDWAFIVKCVRPIPTYDIILIDNCDDECSEEGRAFRHETDCSSYYLCSNGKKILKHCTAGLHFNVTLQICDYPHKTSCDLPDNSLSIFTLNDCPLNSTENIYIPHKCKCTHYYECINGNKILHECPDGLHFDKIQQICNDPTEDGCIPLKSTPTSTISTTKWIEETDKTTLNDLDPSTCIGTCPEEDPQYAVLLPNEDCKKFCMCSNGIAWVQYCPKPLYFDSKDTVCKTKRDAICGKRSFNQDNAVIHRMVEDENSMQLLNKQNNDLDPSTCIGTCPEQDPEYAVLLPNDDCKKFCLCSNGIAWVQPCPEPLYFDSKDKVCKNKRDAICGKRSFNQESASILHRIVDDENSMQLLKEQNNDLDPSTCIGTCPEQDPEYAVLLPNDDCKKFCLCSNGIAWVQPCPEPLYFDSKDKVCKNKRDAICGKRSFNQDSASILHRIVDDENSMQSLKEQNNDLDPSTCIGTCPEQDPEYAVLLPNDDCKKFCLCSNGIAWVQPCPEPLYFDSKDKVCKNKRDAICGERLFNQDSASILYRIVDDENSMQSLKSEENKNEQKIYDNSWFKVHRYNPSSFLKYNPTSTISTTRWFEETNKTTINDLDPSTCIGICPDEDPEYAVLLPNEDCRKFCMCSNSIAWVQYCPEPLYFDSIDTVCKNKRDAVCAVRPFN